MKLSAIRAVRYAQFVITIIVAVSVGVLITERGLTEKQKLEAKGDFFERENERLIGEIKSLERKIDLLRDDSKTIEKVAERKLGMARPADTIYVFTRKNLRPAGNKLEFGLTSKSNSP
ncbi:MAG: FtsB family cell division protein [Desulfomonilaceae bacterium]